MNKESTRTDWARVDALADSEIDYSDAPALDDSFFERPLVDWPPKTSITIRIDADVLAWFKAQGKGYQSRINQLLRRYVDAQRSRQHARS